MDYLMDQQILAVADLDRAGDKMLTAYEELQKGDAAGGWEGNMDAEGYNGEVFTTVKSEDGPGFVLDELVLTALAPDVVKFVLAAHDFARQLHQLKAAHNKE